MKSKRAVKILAKMGLGTLIACILASLVFEVVLRTQPDLLSRGLTDQVRSKYRDSPGGIYYRDQVTSFRLMWEDFETSMYADGYQWHHQTDHRGFRNPPDCPTDILILGDSHIYGHGVEQDETLTAILRSECHLGAYNMARQGDSLLEEYVLTRLYLDELKPKSVVAFVFFNDFYDVSYLKKIQPGLKELEWDYPAMKARIDKKEKRFTVRSQLHRSYFYRLIGGIWRGWKAKKEAETQARSAAQDQPPPPSFDSVSVILDPEQFSLPQAYYEKTLPALAEVCKEAGAELHVVYLHLDYPQWAEAQNKADKFIQDLCSQNQIRFHSTEQVLGDRDDCLLPRDGHINALGHRTLGLWLGEELENKSSP
jgi:hypothetical protein